MIAFLSPFWLLAIPAAGALLLYAYLRHGRNKELKTSSLFFIKQVAPSVASGRRKTSLPWRLILELLIISAIIAALAGTFLKDASGKMTIIIDNSLSMGALLSPGDGTDTLLEEAKRSAKSNLDLFSKASSVSVWITSPEPREITEGFIDNSLASSRIDDIRLSFASADITRSLTAIGETVGDTLIFSDQSLASESQNPKIKIVPLNVLHPRRENIAIESLFIDANLESSDSRSTLTIRLKSFLLEQAQCQINVSSFKEGRWNALSIQRVSLKGFESKALTFTEDFSSAQAVRARIETCNPNKANALKFDDVSWISTTKGEGSITLVSDFSSEQLRLPSLFKQQIRTVAPDRWEGLFKDSKTQNSSLIIFHRFLPSKLPPSNALFVSPPEGSNLIKVSTTLKSAALIRWDNTNPITQYLVLPDLAFNQARIFNELPAWLTPLMHSSAGPVAATGVFSGNRYAVVGFEILPFEGRRNPFISVLTLNMLRWLESSGDPQLGSTRLRKKLSQVNSKATILDSVMENNQVSLSNEGLEVRAEAPALIESRSQKSSELLALNVFLEQESNTLEPGKVSLPSFGRQENAPLKTLGQSLEVYLIMIALLVLILDSMRYLLRKAHAK